jgi:hypothetical protein
MKMVVCGVTTCDYFAYVSENKKVKVAETAFVIYDIQITSEPPVNLYTVLDTLKFYSIS